LSERPFTLRVKVGVNEVEITGDPREVMRTLDELPQIVKKVTDAFGASQPVQAAKDGGRMEQAGEEEYPALTLDPGVACPDAIVRLLATEWGRKRPRTLGEIIEALKVNALHYPEGTVKGRLTDLTKRGTLRRIKEERGYGYILVKPLSGETLQS
jgi:hypothetical protein